MKISTCLFAVLLVLSIGVGAALPAPPATVAPPNDDAINHWVAEALANDPRIDARLIASEATDGIVTLNGQVDSITQQQYALLETEKIRGVRGVIDRITVNAGPHNDDELSRLIGHRIRNSMVVGSKNIGVTVKNGETVLYGTVHSFVEKQEAAILAGEVRGVSAVDNQIEVEYDILRPDDSIRRDILQRLHLDVYLLDAPIDVTVTDGIAVLSGRVDSPYQKQRAFLDSYEVPNVTDVTNRIEITWRNYSGERDHDPTRSDRDLSRAIEDMLALDTRLAHPWRIHISAEKGHVVLTGKVATFNERMVAGQDAEGVVGAAWVDNAIQVKPVPRSDAAMFEDARFNLDSDGALFGDLIKVAAHSGRLVLTGTVHSYYQKIRAFNDVAHIVGVAQVTNRLDITTHIHIADDELKTRITNRLTSDWTTWPVANAITIKAGNGRITLTGTVDDWQQRQEADRLARLTDGVLEVDNRLTVRGVPYYWEKRYGTDTHTFVYTPYNSVTDPFK